MALRPYPTITVNEKAARALRAGHPWVYGAETTGPEIGRASCRERV